MSKVISAKHECRVWAKGFIAENIFFGPFQGDFTQLIKRVQFLDTPPTPFEDSGGRDSVKKHDSLHGDCSWMGEVNPARTEEEQNMEAIRIPDEQIYFRATRAISPGEELRVWLAPSLEKEHGIQGPESDERFKLDCQWICQYCQESFQYSRALSAHIAFGCGALGSSTSTHETMGCKMDDVAAIDGLAAVDADERFKAKHSAGQCEETEDEYEETGISSQDYTTQHYRLSSPDDTVPRINETTSATLGDSRVMSNPRLARLISSFSRPRFRKFTNETQSLAEYHKQEFRKKFQGNEHYLRRHLYRENMERKNSIKRRCPLVLKEDRNYSLRGDQDEVQVKEEKEEFINCFREDYTLGRTSLPSSPAREIFKRGKTTDVPRYNFQAEDLQLNDSLDSYSNVRSSTAAKAALITRGYLTLKANETHHVDEERLSRETARGCTCREHNSERDIPKQRQSSTANDEMSAAEDDAAEGNQQRPLDTSPSKQLSEFGSQKSRLGPFYVYQRTQRDDHVTYRQHLQCYCCSTPPLYAPNENVTRYHEPTFLVEPMYRFSPYPRMLPFFAQHTTNSPQTSPRNQGFTCEFCGKVYCRKYVLKIHMRTHTGFKPLRCKVCDKTFSDPSNMKKHVKLHETEDTVHKCRHCGRNFVRYRGLLNHIKSKHSEHVPIGSL